LNTVAGHLTAPSQSLAVMMGVRTETKFKLE